MRVLLAALLVFGYSAFTGPLAIADVHCVDADSHVELIVESMPMGEVAETITGNELTIFLAAFNATTPVTNLVGDRIVIISSEIWTDRLYAVLINEDCVVFGGTMKADTLPKYKRGIPLKPVGRAT